VYCPRCGREELPERVTCPGCRSTFDARALEALDRLDYVVERVEGWRDEGVLPAAVAGPVLERAGQEMELLQRTLGLLPPAVEAPSAAPLEGEASLPEATPPPARTPEAVPAPTPEAAPASGPTQEGARTEVSPPAGAPARPPFSWSSLGTSLLSERTLHALLGLGAFLILSSGAVISVLNPTGLGPVAHLASVFTTAFLFYAAGWVVRQRLRLTLTGTALLAIGGAFVPLGIWTLGQERLLDWSPGTVWLVASTLGLPLYLGSYLLLRDRIFAALTAVAGGSEILALAQQVGLPLEWGLCLLLVLTLGYVVLARRLAGRLPELAVALSRSALGAAPLVVAGLTVAKFLPGAFPPATGWPAAGVDEYAVGAAWWLGAAVFALAARLQGGRSYAYAAAWMVPGACLFTLTKAPWSGAWYGLCLAGLAALYVLYGSRRRFPDAPVGVVLRDPVYQVGFALTGLALLWPWANPTAREATLWAVAAIYAGATVLLRRRVLAYVGATLMLLAYELHLRLAGVDPNALALAWAALAAVLLGAGEVAAARTGEARRPLDALLLGHGPWRSRFATPLYGAGHVALVFAAGLGLKRLLTAPETTVVPAAGVSVILGLLAVVALYAASAVRRRSGVLLYPAAWLFHAPYLVAVELVWTHFGWPLPNADTVRLLAGLAVAYLALAYAVDRFGGPYSAPLYLTGYAFLCWAVLGAIPIPDRPVLVQVLGLGLLVSAWSAWLVDRGRHTAYLWAVRSLFPAARGRAQAPARALFVYLTASLFPVWLLLALSLWRPAPGPAVYGLVLNLLAPAYVAAGYALRGRRSDYRWPLYLTGYALSVLGLARVATQDSRPVVVAGFLAGAALYGGSAWLFRERRFAYPLAATLSVAYLVALGLTPLDRRWLALGLLPGIAGMLAAAEVLRRRLDTPAGPGGRRLAGLGLDSWSAPFYGLAYLGALALPAFPAPPGPWAAAWWGLAAVALASAACFRHPAWLHPGIALSLVAWLATVWAVAPSLSLPESAATLLMPTALLLGLGCALDRQAGRWTRPLVGWGWGALVISAALTQPDPAAALQTAGAYALLLTVLSLRWRRPAEAWGSLALGALAFQALLRLRGVPLGDQPPAWAVLAFGLSLLAIALRRRPNALLVAWPRPLYLGSTAISGAALLGAVVWQLLVQERASLQPLTLTSALAGLTLLAHALDRRARPLAYQGVALLLLSGLLELARNGVGQAQAYILPIGLYLLAVAYCEWRWGGGGRQKPLLEVGGVALLLGVSLLQALGYLGDGVDRYAYATVLLGQGVALLGLGAVLHWRRTFFAGALALVADVAILLADPLRAINTWYLVAVVGLAMIALVIFVERQRQRIPVWLGEWRQRLETWD
jgi:hypothetical protein